MLGYSLLSGSGSVLVKGTSVSLTLPQQGMTDSRNISTNIFLYFLITQKETYIRGMIATRVAGVSGSLLSPHTQKRWTELRRGKPLLNLYGSTEVLLICSMRWENPEYSDMVYFQQSRNLHPNTDCLLVLDWTSGARS